MGYASRLVAAAADGDGVKDIKPIPSQLSNDDLESLDYVTFKEARDLRDRYRAMERVIVRKVVEKLDTGVTVIRNSKGVGTMRILAKLAALNTDRSDLGELVELAVEVQAVKEGFESFDIPLPEAISDGLDSLRTEIETRKADAIKKRLRELLAADAADKTTNERREDRAKERERLQAQLAGKKDVPTPA